VNGHPCAAEVSPTLRLLDFLRDHLYLTGAREGCGEGECGACTVLMDGRAVLSCLVLAFQADGREILTVEGLARAEALESTITRGHAAAQEHDASEQAHAAARGHTTGQEHGPFQGSIPGPGCSGLMDPLQQAFIDHGAIQCGYCTPGMLMSAKGLLMTHPGPTEQEIRTALSGNMCRCTGYIKIIEAVQAAADSQAAEATHAAGIFPSGDTPFQNQTTPFGQKK
jgi:aerobic carbon-monoxide dehydrogenase small subunit